MSKFASRSVLNAYYAVLYSSHTTNNSNNQHSHNRCSSSFEFLHCLPHTPIHFESVDSVTPENFDICDNSTTDGDMDLRHLRPWWMQSSEDPIDTEQVLWWNLNNSLAEPNNYEMDTADEDEEEEESEGEEECYEDEDDEQCSDGGTPFDDMDNTNVYAIRNGQYVLQSLQEWLDNPRRPSRNNSQPAPLTERHLR